ncbi:MAG TPA: sodium transporter, partial [Ferruginibacter sp.]|nr:sodium transporter [Ferruginibacter sp.]
AKPLLGSFDQAFQYIQEYTGFVSPGIFAMFILGFFWKKTSSNAALFAIIGGFLLSVLFKFLPGLVDLSFLADSGFSKANKDGVFEIPFLDRMGFVFLFSVIGMYIISVIDNRRGIRPNGLEVDSSLFKMNTSFVVGSLIVCAILVALFSVYW